MKIILIYIVSNHHLRNLELLRNIYKNYKFIVLHEDNFEVLTNLKNLKKNILILILLQRNLIII